MKEKIAMIEGVEYNPKKYLYFVAGENGVLCVYKAQMERGRKRVKVE